MISQKSKRIIWTKRSGFNMILKGQPKLKLRKILFFVIAIGLIFTLTECMPWADRSNAGNSEGMQIGGTSSFTALPNPEDYQYYDTLDEAITHDTFVTGNVTHIDERIKLFQNSQYAVLFFKSNMYGNDALYVFKFYVREINGTPHYSSPIVGGNIMWKAHKLSVQQMNLDAVGEVRLCISRDSLRQFRIDNTKNFFWGISSSPKAKNLKIEGQPATEVIPVKMDGDTAYFWYFADLKTDKKPVFQDIQKYVKGDFDITMD